MDIDETSDGIIDDVTGLGRDHNFSVTYSSSDYADGWYNVTAQTFQFNITYTLTNEIGQAATGIYKISVSNNTQICALQNDLEEGDIDSSEANALVRFFNSLGNDIGLGGQLFALLILVVLTGFTFIAGIKSEKVNRPELISAVVFIIGLLILTFAGIISYLVIVIIAFITAAITVYLLTKGG